VVPRTSCSQALIASSEKRRKTPSPHRIAEDALDLEAATQAIEDHALAQLRTDRSTLGAAALRARREAEPRRALGW
jgi:hypothetical protein